MELKTEFEEETKFDEIIFKIILWVTFTLCLATGLLLIKSLTVGL